MSGNDEVKIVFVFSGKREGHRDLMRQLTKYAEELGLLLEERHAVGPDTVISWMDPEALQRLQQGPLKHAGYPTS